MNQHNSSAVNKALADLDRTRSASNETSARLEKSADSAEKTLENLRSTLARWDSMKKRFSDALDSSIRRIAESMAEDGHHGLPQGPPAGPTAHGLSAPADLPNPICVLECNEVARPKMFAGLLAHEYRDTPEALRAKVKLLAQMLRRAKGRTALYTGAGISTGAGIPDYASKSGSTVVPSTFKFAGADPFNAGRAIDAAPTYAHYALVSLHAAGYVEEWVQQNHDLSLIHI